MRFISNKKVLLMAFALGILATVFAAVNPAYAQCSPPSDQDVISRFYAKMGADKNLASQVNQLNFSVVKDPVSGAVQAWKPYGWVKTSDDVTRVFDIMGEVFNDLGGIKCVGSIMFNPQFLKTESEWPQDLKAGTCSGSTEPCGDICIPKGESCNIKGR